MRVFHDLRPDHHAAPAQTSARARARSSSPPPAHPTCRSPRKRPSRPRSWATPSIALYDVGVAGLHRLLAEHDRLAAARVIIVVAGMEGALPSVVGGLVSVPVIAVPTSVGYGASFGGLAALLAMLNSCATGVSVVNIDNGFGAAAIASAINHLERIRRSADRECSGVEAGRSPKPLHCRSLTLYSGLRCRA